MPHLSNPLIAVYDRKTGLFDPPFMVKHVGHAIREFDIVKRDPNTKFGKNPEDFDLFQVGEFDESTGNASALTPHLHLASGVS